MHTSCSCTNDCSRCSCISLRQSLLIVEEVVNPVETHSKVVNHSLETIAPINLHCLGSFPSQSANIGRVLSFKYSRHTFRALLKRNVISLYKRDMLIINILLEFYIYHASILLSGKYDSSSFSQLRSVTMTVSSKSQLPNEYSKGEPLTSSTKHFRLYLCTSKNILVFFKFKYPLTYRVLVRIFFFASIISGFYIRYLKQIAISIVLSKIS